MKNIKILAAILILAVWAILLSLSVYVAVFSVAKADTPFVCVVHKGEWLWVRDAPSKDAKQIDTIRFGVEGEIHEIRNGYARVSTVNNKHGWVDVSYLEIPIKEEIYIVNTDGPLNKRETPDGRYMTKIKSGVRISVLGWRYSKSGELWAKVYHGGYVKAQYLVKADQ